MAFSIKRVNYFNTSVKDQPGEAYKLLSQLAQIGINLLAFTAVPIGPEHTQLTIIPEDMQKLQNEAEKSGITLDGPNSALLIQGDDELGALADVHQRLAENNINVYASSGVAYGSGSYGYLVYVKQDVFNQAAKALGL